MKTYFASKQGTLKEDEVNLFTTPFSACPAFNSKPDVITKDNYHEPGPYSYSQSVGSSITATCNQGYELVGTKNFVCQADGTWSYGSSPPACLGTFDRLFMARLSVDSVSYARNRCGNT